MSSLIVRATAINRTLEHVPKIQLKLPLFDGPRLDGVRVLLVEDDDDSRETLGEIVHMFGAD